MEIRKALMLTSISGIAVFALVACGSNETPVASTNVEIATPAPSNNVEPTAAPTVEVTTEALDIREESGGVVAEKGQFFLFPIPAGYLSSNNTSEWAWEIDFDDTFSAPLGDSSTDFPESTDSPEVAQGDAEGGQLWQAKDKTGTTEAKYSYIDPVSNVRVKGVYTITVK